MSTRTVWASIVLVAGLLGALAGCSGETYPTAVTGETGLCSDNDTVWSGDPLPLVPGTVLERTVRCPEVTTSDERTSGAAEHHFRCQFSQVDRTTIGDCVVDSTPTNDAGTWYAPDGHLAITLEVMEPTKVVQDTVYTGAGDYEGLRYTNHVTSSFDGTDHDYPWQITGTIERDD